MKVFLKGFVQILFYLNRRGNNNFWNCFLIEILEINRRYNDLGPVSGKRRATAVPS